MNPSSRLRLLLAAAPVAVSLLLAPALQASPLLTAAYEAQLEAWLGQGNLTFTNVFTKQAGDKAVDFHAAVNGQGATFTLMSISGHGSSGAFDVSSQVIGGYNPQSWSSSNAYNITASDAARTAFLYNLTGGTILRQNLAAQGEAGSGQYQTYNGAGYGPVFGAGFDLAVTGNLAAGSAYDFSFGGTSLGAEVVSGSPNVNSTVNPYFVFDVGALEVWTFAPAASAVPDTAGTLGLLGISLLALAAFRRRMA